MKALVFQHVGHESAGFFGDLMLSTGFEVQTIDFEAGDSFPKNTGGYDVLVIMGGPMNVYEDDKYPHLDSEIRFAAEFIKNGGAVMGICLGAQIVAAALGARVLAGAEKEIGWHDIRMTDEAAADPLFSLFAKKEKVFQWHGDTFEIPRGAVSLAFSDAFPNQAFRYGRRAYALQFHLETDEKMIRDWLAREENKKEIDVAGVSEAEIERGMGVYGDGMRRLAGSVFGAFLKLV